MTLKSCTKDELIYIINYIYGRQFPSSKDYCINSALNEIEHMRIKAEFDRADELVQISTRKRNEYVSIMKSFVGKKIADIPLDVMRKASALLEEAQKADEEYDKIMKEV